MLIPLTVQANPLTAQPVSVFLQDGEWTIHSNHRGGGVFLDTVDRSILVENLMKVVGGIYKVRFIDCKDKAVSIYAARE